MLLLICVHAFFTTYIVCGREGQLCPSIPATSVWALLW